MALRILNQAEVTALLPMQECIDVMDAVLRTLSGGGAQLPLRTVLRLPAGKGYFGVMPAQLSEPSSLGLKAIGVFPGNEGTRLDSHQGLVILVDPENGSPIAVMDASSITAIRTAAVSAVATRALARTDAGDLALLGTGVQARTHLEAMLAVRRIRRVRAFGRTQERLLGFVRWARERLEQEVEAVASPQECVVGADLICTVTASPTPVVQGDWLSEGAHLNAVGSSIPTTRELDTRAMRRGRLVVDRLESARHEAGDFLIPLQEGALTEAHILGELGDVLLGRIVARRGPSDITIFKSLGLAVEDLAAAHHVLGKARAAQVGLETELGGLRD
ncbi:MAG TPA: ornithine cyclodeaminase family protein [Gemmatimonadales bacterium]|jgi:ornithine cyclodeaminase|nr:ornithine cyclodeaminase family protein [Gemmatimonadales bacterium]